MTLNWRVTALAGATLLVGMTAAVDKPAAAAGPTGGDVPGAIQMTTGSHYDRNAAVVQDGATTWMFFVRSQNACDRLLSCDADNSVYDLWARTSTDRGNRWSKPQMIAANPAPASFRGRTVAATVTAGGALDVFWASGSNSAALYFLTHDDTGWSSPRSLGAETYYFNVAAVTSGGTVYVYFENGVSGGIWVSTFDGTSLGTPSLVASGLAIPKVIVDDSGTFRLTAVDPGSGTVYVASSSDGVQWTDPVAVAKPHDAVTNWDPSLVQLSGGRYLLFFAPDLDTSPDTQRIDVMASDDFASWSPAMQVTGPDGFEDYWPVAATIKGDVTLFFTSEAGDPAGTGHIWDVTAKDACRSESGSPGACVSTFGG